MRGVGVSLWVPLALLFLAQGSHSSYEELAKKYAPRLRFDSKAGGPDGYCLPSSASDYYDQRMSGNTSRICNLEYGSVEDGSVPTYWQAQVCGHHLHIAYWSFYGYNDLCDLVFGARDAWFSNIVVKIRDYDLDERMHEVRYSQKDGWYTRIPGRYEVVDKTHPVAYVGKANHGYYHDDGGTGTCCYFEDYRDPGNQDQHMETWLNLEELDGKSAWMVDNTTNVWNGIDSPMFRSDWDLCDLNGCTGAYVWLCSTSGCYKSDTGAEHF